MDKKDSNLLLLLLSTAVLIIGTFILTNAVQKAPGIRLNRASEKEVQKELASGFPEFPEYPGAVRESFAVVDDKGNYKAEWRVGETVPAVTAWYRDNLPKEGWTVDLVPADWNDQGVQLLEASRGEKTVSVSVLKKPDGKSLIVAEQREKDVPKDEEEE